LEVGPEGTELLNKAGYANAVNMEAGIKGWADAGLPVQK
jgi:rhodanese-related sulfurtransferase